MEILLRMYLGTPPIVPVHTDMNFLIPQPVGAARVKMSLTYLYEPQLTPRFHRWELDVFEFAMAQHSPDGMARIVRRVPPGLDVARERLMRLVDEARAVAGNLPPGRVVLGGFSQVRGCSMWLGF